MPEMRNSASKDFYIAVSSNYAPGSLPRTSASKLVYFLYNRLMSVLSASMSRPSSSYYFLNIEVDA